MKFFDTSDLAGPKDWSGPTLTGFDRAAVKLRWTDKPFEWHRNDGPEAFLVLTGTVDMHIREPGREEQCITLGPGQMLLLDDGEEHVAIPRGEARLLVVERETP